MATLRCHTLLRQLMLAAMIRFDTASAAIAMTITMAGWLRHCHACRGRYADTPAPQLIGQPR